MCKSFGTNLYWIGIKLESKFNLGERFTVWDTLQIELEFGSVDFLGEGKLEYLHKKNLSEQGREPTTNFNHTWSESGNRFRDLLVVRECSQDRAIFAYLDEYSRQKFLSWAFHVAL